MSQSPSPQSFGRVEPDGTVYVLTSAGERNVGQVPDATPEEALEFYVRRYTALETEVGLLDARVKAGALSVDEARKLITKLKKDILEANAVGDLEGLAARLDGLTPALEAQAEAKKAERAEANAKAKEAKEAMVTEAEKLAEGNDWRGGVNRFRALLEEWKALPRIDRATDDALWHRFSAARTTYTRRRKAQFAEMSEKQGGAQALKEKIIEEAKALAESTEWGPTAGAFRDLMTRWKAAGAAARNVDDKLWQKFRGLQDQFFEARNSALSEQDAEFKENQTAKEALLDEAEKTILPVTDLEAAKVAHREFLSKFNELGKVPRDAIRKLDDRVRKLDQAVKAAEEEEWRRTDPEARQRAQDTVDMFSAQIAKLNKQLADYEKAGNAKKVKDTKSSIESCEAFLAQAQKAVDEFTV